MIRGYVSSDEDDYDFGYSKPLVRVKPQPPTLPKIYSELVREKLHLALKESEKIKFFFETVSHGDLAILQELIEAGVSPDCSDSQHWTALMRSCAAGNVEIVEFLLRNGADSNKHRELLTPLMICCTQTLVDEELKLGCVNLLLEHGASVNATDKFRTTALMYASGGGYTSIVTRLLEVEGINVNIQDKDGWTAVFHAVIHNHKIIVEKLVSAGTKCRLTDKDNRRAMDLALSKGLEDVAKILGYVEKVPRKSKAKESLIERLIKSLPNEEGNGGFCEDAREILHLFSRVKTKISLPDLLNATDKDLYDMGVKLTYCRKKILTEGIHKYHLHPWKTSSMPEIVPKVPMSMENAVAILGSAAKHLTIANASVRYLQTRILLRHSDEKDIAVYNKIIISLVNSHVCAENMRKILSRISESVQKIQPKIEEDYIFPYKPEKRGRKISKFMWCLIGVAAAGFAFRYFLYYSDFAISIFKLPPPPPLPKPTLLRLIFQTCQKLLDL